MEPRTNADWITAFAAYLTRRFPDRATTKHYVSDMQIFVRAHPVPLPDVTRAHIDAFVDAERARGCAPATVKRRAATLTSFFAFMAEELDDPTRPNPVCMRRHAGRQPQHLPRDLSDREVQDFLPVLTVVRDLAMACLMLYAGLRVGEVATLRHENLTIPDDPTDPIRLRVLGKGRKERVVYLVRAAFQPLQTYLQTDPPPQPTDPLFRSRTGTALTVAAIQARITDAAQRSGVAVTCHRLRHTYGRWMAEGEMPVLALSRLLGHASIQTTQRYIDGANPQVQRQYEAAIRQVAAVADPDATPAARPDPIPAPVAAESVAVTVVRPPAPPVDGQRWLPDAPAAIREGVLAWLNHQWGLWKPSQRQHHARKRLRELRAFWQWQLAHRPVTTWAELRTDDVAAYIDTELARGIAPTTVKTTVDRVYAVARYLVGQGTLTHLPVRPTLTLPDPLPRHLSPAEVIAIETVLHAPDASGPDAPTLLDRTLYYLLCHAGLRISEVLDLKVQDVDLAGRRIRVREGKGRRDRVVYLSTPATQAMTDYLPSVPHAPGDLVVSTQHRPVRYEEAWARMRALGRAAGVAGVSPHRLRHTYATQLLNHGMSLEGLRNLMGHENLETTLIYARLADTTLEQQYRGAMDRVTNRGNVKLM